MSGKKRFISLMLAVVMLISQFATMGAAADGVTRTIVDDIYNESPSDADILTSEYGLYSYRILEDNTVQIYEYLDWDNTEATVPEKIDDRTVTSIYDYAFSDHSELQEITLPDTLVHIGYRAFSWTGFYYSQIENSSDYSVYIGQYLVYANGAWGEEKYSNILNVKEGTTLIADGAIINYYATHLPTSIAYIGNDNELSNHITYAGSEEDWEKISVFSSDLTPDHVGVDANVYVEKNRVEASCWKSGSYDFACSLCDFSITEEIGMLDHTKGEKLLTIAPSCKTWGEGYSVYKCAICSSLFDADYVREDKPHTKGAKIETIAPTCTDTGYTLYECAACNSVFESDYTYSDRYNEDLGHENGQLIETVEPSCQNGGEGYYKYDCLHCDDCVYEYFYDGEGSYHNYQLIETVEPSCANDGEGYKYYVCSICDDSYRDYFSGSYEHNYVYKERVMQTCETDGYNLYECTECKETRREDWIYAFGHVEGKLISEQKTANCLSPAYKEYSCLICKENYKEIENSDYAPHNFVNGACKVCKISANDVVESEHNYDSDLDKTWTITRKCDYLNITFSAYTYTENNWDYIYIYDGKDNLIGKYTGRELAGKTVKVMGGTAKIRLTSDGDTTRYGFSTTKIEAVCNHTYNAGVVTKAATCTANGVKTYTCTKCNGKKAETIKASGHKIGAGVVTKAATTKATGVKTYSCTVCKTVIKSEAIAKIVAESLKKASVTIKAQAYTGKALKPNVTVKLGKKTLKKGTDFTVSYKNNKNVGKATVTIKGKGNYTGTITKTFKINPKKLTGIKVKAGKKQMTVSWKKASVTGYEIVYATSMNFKKGKKTVTVNSAKTANKVIKKLTAKKIYYVKVRAYKTVKKAKYYSAYTSAKKVKIKK